MGVNYDSFVKTKVIDESIVTPTPALTETGFAFLFPIFAGEGEDNVIKRKYSGLVAEYGEDMDNVRKYGHSGMIANQVVKGGWGVDICRLLPDDAARASLILGIEVGDEGDIPQYKTDADGNIEYDADGNPIQDTETVTETLTRNKQAVYESNEYAPDTDGGYQMDLVSGTTTAEGDEVYIRALDGNGDPIPVTGAQPAYRVWVVNGTTQTDDNGNTLYIRDIIHRVGDLKFDANGDPVYVQATDANGQPLTDANGNPVYETEEYTVTSEQPVTLRGVKVAVTTKPYDYSLPASQALAVKDLGNKKFYPLIAIDSKGRGAYGNNLGIRFDYSERRDGKSPDGRRYEMRFYRTNKNGIPVAIDNRLEHCSFAINPTAVAIPGSNIPDDFNTVYGEYSEKFNIPLNATIILDAYEELIEVLDNYFDGDATNIDFIGFKDIKGNPYPRIRVDVADHVDLLHNIEKLSGGSEGSLSKDWLLEIPDGETLNRGASYKEAGTDMTKEEAIAWVAATKGALLEEFFKGNIDDNIYDSRIVDSGVVLDCWYPDSVKRVLADEFINKVRDDMGVVLDLGPDVTVLSEVEAKVAQISAYITGEDSGRQVAINIHNVVTTDRAKNVVTSGNYEVAGLLPYVYGVYGPFTALAGAQAGKMRYSTPLYAPKVVRDNLQIKPLQDKNVIFAMKLERGEDYCFMSDDSKYNKDFSVLGSFSNVLYLGEIMRTCRKVLVKKTFDPNGAKGSIASATRELDDIFSKSWFPSKFGLDYTIFQTRDDQINNEASVDMHIYYPDVVGGFNVTIHNNRQPANK